jgi:hypothetical protein
MIWVISLIVINVLGGEVNMSECCFFLVPINSHLLIGCQSVLFLLLGMAVWLSRDVNTRREGDGVFFLARTRKSQWGAKSVIWLFELRPATEEMISNCVVLAIHVHKWLVVQRPGKGQWTGSASREALSCPTHLVCPEYSWAQPHMIGQAGACRTNAADGSVSKADKLLQQAQMIRLAYE